MCEIQDFNPPKTSQFRTSQFRTIPLPRNRRGRRGIMLYNKNNNKILIVLGREHNKYGIPKGAMEIDDYKHQFPYLYRAYTELYQETGIFLPIQNLPSVRIDYKEEYYILEVNQEFDVNPIDKNEISGYKWVTIEEIKKIPNINYGLNYLVNNITLQSPNFKI